MYLVFPRLETTNNLYPDMSALTEAFNHNMYSITPTLHLSCKLFSKEMVRKKTSGAQTEKLEATVCKMHHFNTINKKCNPLQNKNCNFSAIIAMVCFGD